MPVEAPRVRDAAENDQGETRPPDNRDFKRTSEIHLALDPSSRVVLIAGLPPIKGEGTFSLIDQLVEAHDENSLNKRAPENYRFVAGGQLATRLAINDVTLRKRVMRLRRKVANAFQRRFGLTLAGDAVIQSTAWSGYRLNPAVRVLAPDQIESAPKRHEFGSMVSRLGN